MGRLSRASGKFQEKEISFAVRVIWQLLNKKFSFQAFVSLLCAAY